MANQLYLIRHAETGWSTTHQYAGAADIPLDSRGVRQARELGQCIRDLSFDHVFVSPQLRTRQTCELAGLSSAAKEMPSAVEWKFGEYEGKTAEQIMSLRPNWDIYRDGCPAGECAEDVERRADETIAAISAAPGTVALFSHGQFIRVLTTRWVGWPIETARNLVLGSASISILAQDAAGKRSVSLWNYPGCGAPPRPRL